MDCPRVCPARWLPDFGVMSRDILCPFYDMHLNYLQPWKCINQNISKEFGSTVENEKGNYKITLDVQHFHPNDISVKVTETEIIVEGKHEERPDTHGFISRQFKRRYALPSHCSAESVSSTMSSDGVLTINAEKRTSNAMEKIVPIKMCVTCPRTQFESKFTLETIQTSVKENVKDTEDTISKNKTKLMLKEDHSCLLKPKLLKETILDTNGEKVLSKQVIDSPGISGQKDAINSGTKKIEESLAKFSSGLSELTEQLGQRSLASTSELSRMKGISSKTLIEESSSSYKSSSSSMSSTKKSSGKTGEGVSDISAELREAAENV